jgi:hypothetical protein
MKRIVIALALASVPAAAAPPPTLEQCRDYVATPKWFPHIAEIGDPVARRMAIEGAAVACVIDHDPVMKEWPEDKKIAVTAEAQYQRCCSRNAGSWPAYGASPGGIRERHMLSGWSSHHPTPASVAPTSAPGSFRSCITQPAFGGSLVLRARRAARKLSSESIRIDDNSASGTLEFRADPSHAPFLQSNSTTSSGNRGGHASGTAARKSLAAAPRSPPGAAKTSPAADDRGSGG